jgi:hypothetical protein
MSLKDLEDAKAKAEKVLGKGAEMPKERVDLAKLFDNIDKCHDKFSALSGQLEDAIVECENSLSEFGNAVKQNSAIYEKNDFGLNSKRPNEEKLIKQAQAIMAAAFAAQQKTLATSTKTLDELDKHVIQLSKYKGPSL